MKRFEGKTALITGSARGIGRGIALCLAEEGANVVVNDRSNEALAEETVEEIKALGVDAVFLKADVSKPDQVATLLQEAIERFGRIDIVVSNAAYSIRNHVVDTTWEEVLATLEVTQFGVFHVCQAAARHMIQQSPNPSSRGKIVVISSVQSEVASEGCAAYNMAKAAINHFASTLAAELAPSRINVNVITPGWIDTPGERAFYSEEKIQEGGKRLPWGRIGTPRDIGKAVAYLASDDADYVTGSILKVDGGYVVARSAID